MQSAMGSNVLYVFHFLVIQRSPFDIVDKIFDRCYWLLLTQPLSEQTTSCSSFGKKDRFSIICIIMVVVA